MRGLRAPTPEPRIYGQGKLNAQLQHRLRLQAPARTLRLPFINAVKPWTHEDGRKNWPLRAYYPEAVATSLTLRNSPGLQSVAELASAWAQVARRLPQHRCATCNQDCKPGEMWDHERCVGSSSTCGVEGETLIIGALKLALSYLHGAPQRPDGRQPLARAVDLAARLADLSAAGIPLDAEAIAAGVVIEAIEFGGLDMGTIHARCGPGVAGLVHDVLRVRTAGLRVELYDDVASSAIREWCLAMHDVRANVVEVVSRWDDLQHMFSLPYSDQQVLSLEALQLFAPLGHALGLGAVSARVEDLCFKILFPASYTHTSEWLHKVVDVAEDSLFLCQQQLLGALDDHPRFKQLAAGCVIRARTKSLFSIMKKLLRLEDMSRGGRLKEEIFDVLGMRAIVRPLSGLPPAEAEALACEACLVVREVAEQLYSSVPGRSKDYISHPKKNGYQSIHLTMQLPQPPSPQTSAAGGATAAAYGSGYATPGQQAEITEAGDSDVDGGQEAGSAMPFFELQIRTQLMDELSEAGDASHASYKGGLDSRQARQLREWTEQLRKRLALRPAGQLLLPADSGMSSGGVPGVAGEPEGINLAAQALFSNWDQDGNGVLSLEELQEQLRDLGGGGAEADAQALMLFLADEEQVGAAGGGAAAPQEQAGAAAGGERGITLQEFSKFVRKVSLVGALDQLDKQQVQDLASNN